MKSAEFETPRPVFSRSDRHEDVDHKEPVDTRSDLSPQV